MYRRRAVSADMVDRGPGCKYKCDAECQYHCGKDKSRGHCWDSPNFPISTRSDLTLIAWLISTAVWTTLSAAGHDEGYDNNDRVYAHGVPPWDYSSLPRDALGLATELQTSCPMVVDGFQCSRARDRLGL